MPVPGGNEVDHSPERCLVVDAVEADAALEFLLGLPRMGIPQERP
jgi:hypothetical protein